MSEQETPYDEITYRPAAGSVAVDAGDVSYYVAVTNKAVWRAGAGAWLAEAGEDYYGNDRVVNGKIDVGCGEMQTDDKQLPLLVISDSLGGLVVSGDMTKTGE